MARITEKDNAKILKLAARAKGVTKVQAGAALRSVNRANYALKLLVDKRKLKKLDLKVTASGAKLKLGKASRTKVFVLPGKK